MDLSNLEYVERDGIRYDLVEVKLYHWVRRICLFVDRTTNICFTIDIECSDDFLNGLEYNIMQWGKNEWRPLAKKHYVPFTIEDAHLFRDRWIKNDVMWHFNIKCYDKEGIVFDYKYFSFNDAFKLLTFDDGTPFGKEVSHE